MEFEMTLTGNRTVYIYDGTWFREEWGWEFSYKCDQHLQCEDDNDIRRHAHTEFPPEYNPYEDIEVEAFLEERAGL